MRIAERTGIKRDNLYKWARGATPSDPNDLFLLADFVYNVPRETDADVDNGQQNATRTPETALPASQAKDDGYTPPTAGERIEELQRLNKMLGDGIHLSLNAIQVSLETIRQIRRTS